MSIVERNAERRAEMDALGECVDCGELIYEPKRGAHWRCTPCLAAKYGA
jgi:RNA polymerase-binding transcription factor DksA